MHEFPVSCQGYIIAEIRIGCPPRIDKILVVNRQTLIVIPVLVQQTAETVSATLVGHHLAEAASGRTH